MNFSNFKFSNIINKTLLFFILVDRNSNYFIICKSAKKIGFKVRKKARLKPQNLIIISKFVALRIRTKK
jgi:hypothetical protein